MALADHVVVMNAGRIEDQGTAERVYGRPATRFSATFMGESTVVEGKVTSAGSIDTPVGIIANVGRPIGTSVLIAIRPEHIKMGEGIPVRVRDVVYQGSFKRVSAQSMRDPDLIILARMPAEAETARPQGSGCFAVSDIASNLSHPSAHGGLC